MFHKTKETIIQLSSLFFPQFNTSIVSSARLLRPIISYTIISKQFFNPQESPNNTQKKQSRKTHSLSTRSSWHLTLRKRIKIQLQAKVNITKRRQTSITVPQTRFVSAHHLKRNPNISKQWSCFHQSFYQSFHLWSKTLHYHHVTFHHLCPNINYLCLHSPISIQQDLQYLSIKLN